jgi:hypothetical protein
MKHLYQFKHTTSPRFSRYINRDTNLIIADRNVCPVATLAEHQTVVGLLRSCLESIIHFLTEKVKIFFRGRKRPVVLQRIVPMLIESPHTVEV